MKYKIFFKLTLWQEKYQQQSCTDSDKTENLNMFDQKIAQTPDRLPHHAKQLLGCKQL